MHQVFWGGDLVGLQYWEVPLSCLTVEFPADHNTRRRGPAFKGCWGCWGSAVRGPGL